ncbi:hypothetical protein OQA88_6633 [Cercophora sp. LCS_1]
MDSRKLNTQEQKPNDQVQDTGVKKVVDDIKSKFAPHNAMPGPVISQNIGDVKEEGTKEERMAKAQELNK